MTNRILIAGGSIGGLTTALLLRDLGYEVDVYERSGAALQERGTGIVVLPITERYFTERGGEDDRVSLHLTYWSYLDRAGNVIATDPDHFRFSGWNTVYRALLDAFGSDRYHLDSEMVGFDRRRDSVTLHLADGRQIAGDLLVCADGIASTARSILAPAAVPRYAGYVAWRGVTPEAALGVATRESVRDAMLYQVLDRSHVLVYAIPSLEGDTRPGHRIINSVWYRNCPEGAPLDDLMTGVDAVRRTATMPPGTIRPEFVNEMRTAAVEALAPQLAEIVLACPDPIIQAIFDLESPRMVYDRVCLLGDAAFGLRPHIAAGQAKACADAWALRDCLAESGDDIDSALRSWEPKQLALGHQALTRTREMGHRSQVAGTMYPGDPTWKFGLWEPGN